jgi:hypothetical protein
MERVMHTGRGRGDADHPMSLSKPPLGQRTMFNPISYYRKRVAIKRDVFNADKKALDLQALNRFVNGKPERQRTRPTYLRAKTRDRLLFTVMQEWGDGKYENGLEGVAKKLTMWCMYPGGAENKDVRGWLKLLANAKPVERKADEPVKDRSQTSSRLVINGGDDDARSHISSEDDAKSSVSSKDVVPSHRTSEEEFDWSAAFREAMNGIEFAISNDPNKVEPGTEDVGGNTMGSATIDSNLFAEDVSKRENVPKDVSNRLDNRGRQPAPRLRPKSDSAQPRHGVVHMVNGKVVPVKQ